MIKIGIVGAGRLGSFHADKAAAHPEVELIGVMDPVASARKNLARKHQIEEFQSLDELIALVDAMVIAAPTYLHFELGIPCLQRGRHVLMEKPMCGSWSESQKMVAAAKRANVVFQVGHVEEFNPAWHAAQNSLVEAKEGAAVLIDAVRTSGYTFRSTDVGTVFDMMIHDIDLVLSLIPSKVIAVDATGFNVIGGPHEDIADVRVRFENGTIAKLYSSRVETQARREMRVIMPTGSTTIDFATRTVVNRCPDDRTSEGEFAPKSVSGKDVSQWAPTFMQDHFLCDEIHCDAVDALALEMDDFIRAIQMHDEPRVSGERALAAVAVAEMAVESLRRGMPLHFGHPGQRKAA